MMNSPGNESDYLEKQLHLLHLAAEHLASGLGQLWRDFYSTSQQNIKATSEPTDSPCSSCPTRDTCSAPCDKLLQLLPSEDAGRLSLVRHGDIPLDVIHHDHGMHRADSRDLMERFEACRALLTTKRWDVVRLIHGQGLTQKQAAQQLGKAESTVSELLSAATQTMHAFHARQGRKNAASDDRLE